MNGSIRWGVVGSGGIARRRTIPEGIVPARNSRLVAVYDPQEEANRQVAAAFGVRPALGIAEVLAAGVDAVYIASPPGFHREQVLACAAAGKHVLCEKPLGMTVPEAEQMMAACDSAGTRLGCAFMMRFHAQHQAALQLIQQGKLGAPVYARAQLSCWYPPMAGAWRQDPAQGGGGSLIDMGGHCLDLLEMFFGPISQLSCFVGNTVHAYGSEDSAAVLVRFANGALATVDTFFCIPDASSKNVLELYGSQGSILAQGTIGQSAGGTMTAHLSQWTPAMQPSNPVPRRPGIPIAPEPRNTYQAEIEEFSQALLDNRPNPLDARLGLRSQQTLAACYESARTGCAVNVG